MLDRSLALFIVRNLQVRLNTLGAGISDEVKLQLEKSINLMQAIADGDTIADLWSVEDVYSLDSDNFDDQGNYTGDITLEQARDVLQSAQANMNAEYGINWDSLRAELEDQA